MNRNTLLVIVASLLPLSWASGEDTLSIPKSMSAGSADPIAAAEPLPIVDPVLEQGIELYNSGQDMAALDKFMKVLRRDPRQGEAREYLRLVVERLKSQRSQTELMSKANKLGITKHKASALPSQSKNAAQQVRQRQLLTLDLAAIPGVKVAIDSKKAQVEIQTELLFADKTGGLREEGVPLLDRVAAWLKTFGTEPVAIHCLPEEFEDPTLGGSLFLHRYAQLYGYFIDERKLPATRFVSASPMNGGKGSDADLSVMPAANTSTSTARVVIVTSGGRDPNILGEVTSNPARWLEFSITAQKRAFNPEEGDWVTIDLAALAAKEAKAWYFKIIPELKVTASREVKNPEPHYALEGKGNLLKRISWNGRDTKKGNFLPAGNYTAKLTATNADGSDKTEEVTLQVVRSEKAAAPVSKPSQKATVASAKAKPKSKPSAKPKTATPPITPAEPEPEAVPEPEPTAVPMADASSDDAPAASAEETEDSTNAIWKQVIQFDENESDLKPTLKASLERIGKTLEVYPLQKVRILGFATASEKNSAELAKKRAEQIKQTLITEYRVDPERVIVAGGKVGSSGKVEISITN